MFSIGYSELEKYCFNIEFNNLQGDKVLRGTLVTSIKDSSCVCKGDGRAQIRYYVEEN